MAELNNAADVDVDAFDTFTASMREIKVLRLQAIRLLSMFYGTKT